MFKSICLIVGAIAFLPKLAFSAQYEAPYKLRCSIDTLFSEENQPLQPRGRTTITLGQAGSGEPQLVESTDRENIYEKIEPLNAKYSLRVLVSISKVPSILPGVVGVLFSVFDSQKNTKARPAFFVGAEFIPSQSDKDAFGKIHKIDRLFQTITVYNPSYAFDVSRNTATVNLWAPVGLQDTVKGIPLALRIRGCQFSIPAK